MKLTIKNTYFDKSPLTVSMHIGDEIVEKDLHEFTLSLTNDAGASNVLAGCKGVLFSDDMQLLRNFFNELTDQHKRLLQFTPTDPSFILRGQNQGNEVELLWVIDQGMADANYSTDTGVGLLMNISQETLAEIKNTLAG